MSQTWITKKISDANDQNFNYFFAMLSSANV